MATPVGQHEEYWLRRLRDEIESRGLIRIWGESFQDLTPHQVNLRASRRAEAAEVALLRMLRSEVFQTPQATPEWAVLAALGLRTSKRHTAQPTGKKNWRAWGGG